MDHESTLELHHTPYARAAASDLDASGASGSLVVTDRTPQSPSTREGSIAEPARSTPLIAQGDVVVLGGGPSGIAAAAAAARNGARTILVERYGFLGGMGTAAMVTNFCGLHAQVNGELVQVVRGVADDILTRIGALGGLGPVRSVLGRTGAQSYDNAAYKLAADDLLASAGATLVLHALGVGTVVRDGKVEALLVETKSGRGAIAGSVFIDCSGDADLIAWSGAPFEKGDAAGYLAYPTLMFRMGHVDTPTAIAEGKPRLRELMAEAEASGRYSFPRKAAWLNPQPHEGEWRANVTQIRRGDACIDGTSHADLSFAEIEGRRQVREFFTFLKERVPGFGSAYLLEIAAQVGIRETRRASTRYELTVDDVLGCRDFDDGVGVNGWPVEKHVLGDVSWTFLEGRGYHGVPFGSLVPKTLENVLVAGRCAGATQDAQASIRVSGPCFVMGQAAGTAAALAVARESSVPDVDVDELRARLSAQGAFLGDRR